MQVIADIQHARTLPTGQPGELPDGAAEQHLDVNRRELNRGGKRALLCCAMMLYAMSSTLPFASSSALACDHLTKRPLASNDRKGASRW